MSDKDEFQKRMEEFVANTNRQTKIDRIVDDVDTWDWGSTIDFCKDVVRERLEDMTDEDINFDYLNAYDYEIEEAVSEMIEEEQECGPQKKKVCDCLCTAWGITHTPDCPDFRS